MIITCNHLAIINNFKQSSFTLSKTIRQTYCWFVIDLQEFSSPLSCSLCVQGDLGRSALAQFSRPRSLVTQSVLPLVQTSSATRARLLAPTRHSWTSDSFRYALLAPSFWILKVYLCKYEIVKLFLCRLCDQSEYGNNAMFVFVSKHEVDIELSVLNMGPLHQLKQAWNPYIALCCIWLFHVMT